MDAEKLRETLGDVIIGLHSQDRLHEIEGVASPEQFLSLIFPLLPAEEQMKTMLRLGKPVDVPDPELWKIFIAISARIVPEALIEEIGEPETLQ